MFLDRIDPILSPYQILFKDLIWVWSDMTYCHLHIFTGLTIVADFLLNYFLPSPTTCALHLVLRGSNKSAQKLEAKRIITSLSLFRCKYRKINVKSQIYHSYWCNLIRPCCFRPKNHFPSAKTLDRDCQEHGPFCF